MSGRNIFGGGVKEAIFVRVENPSLNRAELGHQLQPPIN